MQTINGLVIKSGLVLGRARLVSQPSLEVASSRITSREVNRELRLLNDAVDRVADDLGQHLQALRDAGSAREILEAHLLILRDPEIASLIHEAVSNKLESAAAAVQRVFSEVAAGFQNLDNEFYAQRSADYRDVQQHLLSELTGQKKADLQDWQPDQIAVLKEPTPSQVSAFSRLKVPAYCSEQGSFTSHASILTRSLNIAAVTALPGLCGQVRDGDALILDAIDGRVIIDPDQPTLLLYDQLREKYRSQEEQEARTPGEPTRTAGGRRIHLRCNLDLLSEIDRPAKLGADGIGLYRTEFLYLGKDRLPSEELQFEIYREVAEKAAPHSVTIRSFDLGGDKLSHLIPAPQEENPYLGCRGIRFSLAQPAIFRTQIRAVLKASQFGRINLMFPMVTDLKDFLAASSIVDKCRQELDAEGTPYDAEMPLGVMIEVPSAALCADELARHCGFLSIGTNDLVQYVLAADRNNSALTPYYVTHHPAVLQLLRQTLAAGLHYGKPVSVCGEMASLPEYVPLLIGMGFTDLSVNPSSYRECRRIIQRCDAELDALFAGQSFSCGLAAIEELIYQRLKPYYHL